MSTPLPRTCCAECGAPLRLRRIVREDEPPAVATLSEREMQVWTLIARGLMPAEMSEQLGIDTKTVYTYRTRLLEKLDLVSNRDLIVLAMRIGLT